MKVIVKRQDGPSLESYWQTFDYDRDDTSTVAAILEYLNYRDDLLDENGVACRRIKWECSCMQKMCGACAMVVNHEPVLACSKFINAKETKEIRIEPLTKFPVVIDLCVDRSCIHDKLKEAEIYIGNPAEKVNDKEYQYQYTVAKCLKCGLCLEVCPNYTGNAKNFAGAVFANESYLTHTLTDNRKNEIKKAYKSHFESGCSKSLACRDICPAKVPTLASIGYMNRL